MPMQILVATILRELVESRHRIIIYTQHSQQLDECTRGEVSCIVCVSHIS